MTCNAVLYTLMELPQPLKPLFLSKEENSEVLHILSSIVME